jgi:hypothetical protein
MHSSLSSCLLRCTASHRLAGVEFFYDLIRSHWPTQLSLIQRACSIAVERALKYFLQC